MKTKSPLSNKKASQLSIDQIEGLFRQNKMLHFQLTAGTEKNKELEIKIELVNRKYIDLQKQNYNFKQAVASLQENNQQLSNQIQSLRVELQQYKHQSKPRHYQNQHLLAKMKMLQDSLPKETQSSASNMKGKRLPSLKLINNIQNYQMNESFKDSPVKQIQSRIQNNERQKRFREIVSNYEHTLNEKNQMQEQCQFLLRQIDKYRDNISELESLNHLLKQENLEYKVRISHLSKTRTDTEEQQTLTNQIEIQLLTESNNLYYSLLESLISAGHSRTVSDKMKQILNLQVQQLNQVKRKIEINHHLEELQYLYKQQTHSEQYQEAQLIQRRKSIQQFRKKLNEANQQLAGYQTDKQNLLFELTSILRHQQKLVLYSLQLQKKTKHQQRQTPRYNQQKQVSISFKKTNHQHNPFRRQAIINPPESSRQSNCSKRRISFYQNSEADDILKDVANKDKQMLEHALRSQKYRC